MDIEIYLLIESKMNELSQWDGDIESACGILKEIIEIKESAGMDASTEKDAMAQMMTLPFMDTNSN